MRNREDMPSKNVPQEHRDAMVAAYLAGATAREAAAQFGYSYMACIFALRQRGIDPRTNSQTHRKYHLDETFFDTISTEEKAYWLGFLTADGTIGVDYVKLALQERDIDHLYKFRASLRSDHPVVLKESTLQGKLYRAREVHVGSMRLAAALKRLGVGERKSFAVSPCEQVPVGLLPHYWRGVFEGDGTIVQTWGRRLGAVKWTVSLVGNQQIVTGFETFMRQCTGWESRVDLDKPGSRIFIVRYSGVALPQAILHVLYHDAAIFLERKYRLACDVMNTPIQRRNT
jgi:hypothetical protein